MSFTIYIPYLYLTPSRIKPQSGLSNISYFVAAADKVSLLYYTVYPSELGYHSYSRVAMLRVLVWREINRDFLVAFLRYLCVIEEIKVWFFLLFVCGLISR